MSEKSTTARYSLSEIKAARERGEDHTRPDAPEADGKGHLTRMNAVLRAYVDAHKGRG